MRTVKQINDALATTNIVVVKGQRGYQVWEGSEPWSTGLYTLNDVKRYLTEKGVL